MSSEMARILKQWKINREGILCAHSVQNALKSADDVMISIPN